MPSKTVQSACNECIHRTRDWLRDRGGFPVCTTVFGVEARPPIKTIKTEELDREDGDDVEE